MKPGNRQILTAVFIVLAAAACKKSPRADVAAEVNSRPITYAELEKQLKLQFPNTPPEVNEDLISNQKLDILRSMIDNEIMLQRAEKLNLMAVDSDVDAKFNELKAPYTQEEFQRQLDARKITAQELKVQIRRDLSIQKLFYAANKASFNLAEPQVHLATILVTPTPDPSVRNLRSDKAQNEDQARRKIQMIEARIRQGEDFAMLAQSFSEDPNTAPNGGDMGFVPESALEQANAELRKMVAALQPGQVSPTIRTAEGYRILKVVSKEPAGQRQLNDPRVQQTIRETLINRKDQLLKAAYYEIARNEAKVANYFAQSVFDRAQQSAK